MKHCSKYVVAHVNKKIKHKNMYVFTEFPDHSYFSKGYAQIPKSSNLIYFDMVELARHI